ncbi:hypothetical protein K501DRAFT_208102 [Backusella circina FSU 941]|nr:hypothetical protein K501DRAFT_208102 [Backusella circina FSU 941]
MKLTGLFCALAVAAVTNASILPGFMFQDEGDFSTDSTNLITPCGDANDLLTIDYVNLTPDPPVKGQNLTIDFKGQLSETVPEGTTVDIIVKYGVVRLLTKKFDFCDQIKHVDETCPIPEGELSFTKDVSLPKEIPPGKYMVHAEVLTPDKKRVTCLVGQTVFPRN